MVVDKESGDLPREGNADSWLDFAAYGFVVLYGRYVSEDNEDMQ